MERIIRKDLDGNDIIIDDNTNWENISRDYKLSEDFMREFQDKLDWFTASSCQILSEDLMRELIEKNVYLNWRFISTHNQQLSEDFMREFQDKFNWINVLLTRLLTEDLIKEIFKNKTKPWIRISKYQILSENFIKEFKDKVVWKHISACQSLSESFIEEFKDYVDWKNIANHQYLSKEFREKYELDKYITQTNWLYKDTSFKKNVIIKNGRFECYDDYFIAYEPISIYDYGCYKDGVVERHADHTTKLISFGLCVYSCDVIKTLRIKSFNIVKVRYEDIARLFNRRAYNRRLGIRCNDKNLCFVRCAKIERG